ncbi:MAG TPA: hypothetical protein VI727_05335 [Candidatus Brocadiaceae bacterium]|nr:hypothetical protein [Candidatus Brocadiaceae bacterium]
MSTVKQKRKDVEAIESLEKKINPVPIKKDDPFFSSAPADIGHTNNKIIDELLYGMKCQK